MNKLYAKNELSFSLIWIALYVVLFSVADNLSERLCKFQGNAKGYLYFIPLVFLASCNLWNGVTLQLSPIESALYVISMLCVGCIEEILFRGFLFTIIFYKGKSLIPCILTHSIPNSLSAFAVTSAPSRALRFHKVSNAEDNTGKRTISFLSICRVLHCIRQEKERKALPPSAKYHTLH